MQACFTEKIRFSRRKPQLEKATRIGRPKNGIKRSIKGFPRGNNESQRVVVQTAIAKPEVLKAHVKYLERDGAGHDGNKPEFFTANNKEVNLGEIEDEKRFFKLIISPENGREIVDLEEYVKDVMRKAENTIGEKLDWAAVTHYNTEHPHAHVIIRGKTEDDRDLVIDNRMMREGFREIAKERATQELGPRSKYDQERVKEKEITAERYTSLDRAIKKQEEKSKNVVGRDPFEKKRLRYLSNIGLAREIAHNVYRLSDNLEDVLRSAQKRNDIVRTVYSQGSSVPSDRQLIQYKPGADIEGAKVIKIGVADELRERPFAVAEKDGYHFYIDGERARGLEVGRSLKNTDLARQRVVTQGARIAASEFNAQKVQLYNVSRESENGRPFGPGGSGIPEFSGKRNFHKIILSPENSQRIEDVKGYTRELVNKTAMALRTKNLKWAAAIQEVNGEKKIHLLIDSENIEGKRVRVDREMLKTGVRYIAEKISTEHLGARTEEDAFRAKIVKAKTPKVNFLDKSLIEKSNSQGEVRPRNDIEKIRLEYLSKNKVIEKKRPDGGYKIPVNLEEKIRELERKVKAERLTGERGVQPYKEGLNLSGATVVDKGVTDDVKARAFAVLEKEGKKIYVEGAAAKNLSVGEKIEKLKISPREQERGIELRGAKGQAEEKVQKQERKKSSRTQGLEIER